jgi:hypothetical protein
VVQVLAVIFNFEPRGGYSRLQTRPQPWDRRIGKPDKAAKRLAVELGDKDQPIHPLTSRDATAEKLNSLTDILKFPIRPFSPPEPALIQQFGAKWRPF